MPVGVNKKKQKQQVYTPKLWLLLVGVNQYEDEQLPSLRYSALDCQGLTEALTTSTQHPYKEVAKYNDFADLPLLGAVRTSLKHITEQAQSEDTILFYFSGHGILDSTTQQCFLCLRDTHKDDLVNTSLALQELLQMLGESAARQQLIWLDACHSGGMTLRGALNPTKQLVQVLQTAAATSKGFYALLSCDINQQSWEFPELGHGVFTYYLMRGLCGEAANSQGVITADDLYRYVYHQTLQYIDKTNQQLRLINQQRRSKGDSQLQREYPLQTPKRIVEGVGDVILAHAVSSELVFSRVALVMEGVTHSSTLSLSKVLRGTCGFELEYLPRSGKISTKSIRDGIQSCLRLPTQTQSVTTALLYLRGLLQETPTGDIALSLSSDVWLSRDWLRLQLRRSSVSQLIIILDCVALESTHATLLQDWVEDLQISTDKGLCIIAAVNNDSSPETFVTALINTLQAAPLSIGLSAAGWISQLQLDLAGALPLHVWLSGTRGIMEIIPSTTGAHASKQTNIDLNICPYLGLRAFTEEDAQYFYGRASLIQNLINHITTQSFLAVVGASGSGKSSVVQAGLISQLRLGKQLPGSEKWLIKSIRPGARPLEVLARLSDDNANVLEGLLYQGVEGFVYWLRSCAATVVLIVDQFEELFTLAPDSDRQKFLELVLGALRYASDKFKLIMTLRADFMAPALEITALAQLLQSSSVLVPPRLSDDDYRSVIIKPAEQVGLKVQAGLVEVLLQELSPNSASDLPLLEFVLEQLWEKRVDGELTLAVYQQHLGGIAGALERRAQAVYDNLDSAAQKCARWIFLSLTQLGEGTEDTRRRVLKSDLAVKKYPPALVERTLQALTAAKLIVMNVEEELTGIGKNVETRYITSFPHPPITIEVAHEILIRHWSTLRWWLEENRNRLRLQRQIEQAAQLWKNNHQQTEFLLQGIRLAEAEEIYIKYTSELSFDVQTFIAACLDEHRRLQLEQKKRLRQTQAALAVISILGASATLFGGFAYVQRQAAQTREVTALNSSSEALLNSHSQLEAIIASIKAGKQLKQVVTFLGAPSQDIRLATAATLQQALSRTQEINRLQAHTDKVNAVSFSPDNKLIATASDDNTVKIWRRDGRLVKTFKNHQDRVTSVVFSHDSKYIASGGADKTIRLNSIDGKIIKTFTGHNDFVTSLTFSPDSKTLVSGSRDQTIRIWKINGNSIIINAHNGWVNTVAVDSKYIVSGGEDNLIKLWQADTGKLVKTVTGHKDRVTRVLFSPDSKSIASASDDSTIKIWSLDGKELQSLTTQANSICFSSDGNILVSGSTDGLIKLWQLDGKLITTYQGHNARVTDIDISTDGIIASSSDDKTIRLWNLTKPNTQNHTIYSVAFNRDGKTLATAGWDGAVNILDDNQKITSIKAHQNIISTIAFSYNTNILATASADKSVKLWNVKTFELMRVLSGHSDRVTSVAFSHDDNIIATAGADKAVKLWRVKDGKLLHTLTGHSDEVTSVAISTDGLVASGSNDNTVKVWRLDGKLVRTLTGHGSAISSLAFTPDGKVLASASWDNTIKLWRSNGELISTLTGHSDGVTSLSFGSDNKILASGSADNTVKFWNLNDNTLIKTLFGYSSQINSISFSPNNKALLTGSETELKLWSLDIDNLMKQSCARVHDYLNNNRDINSVERKICLL